MDEFLALWLLALALAGYGVLARRTRDAFHPLALFLLGWLGVFAFAHLDVPTTYDEPYYALPFGVHTYFAVLTAGMAFAIGFFLADPNMAPLDRERIWKGLRSSANAERLAAVTLGLFAIATATTAYFIWTAGEIPLFSPRINELRRTFKLRYFGYLYDLHYASALFSAMLAAWSRTRRARWGWTMLALTSALLLMSGGVRVSPLTALAWIFIFLALRPGRPHARQVVAAVVIFATVFGVIEQYRRSQYRLDPDLLNPRLDLSVPATLWAHSAASFKNLQLTIDQVTSPLHMGLTSYDLPKTVNPAARRVDQQINALYGTHNTPTFLGFLYFDFGWGGILLMPAIYGALTALVYRRFRAGPRIFWLVVYIDFLLAAALAFRTHRFFGNNLLYFALVAAAVELLAGRRSAGAESAPPGRTVELHPAA